MKGTFYIKGQDPAQPVLPAVMRANLQAVFRTGDAEAGSTTANLPTPRQQLVPSQTSISDRHNPGSGLMTELESSPQASETARALVQQSSDSVVHLDILPLLSADVRVGQGTAGAPAELDVNERDPSRTPQGSESAIAVQLSVVPESVRFNPVCACPWKKLCCLA